MTFVVIWNELHNVINHHMIKMNLESSNKKSYTILAIDTYFKNPILMKYYIL
jgi:hypothetical protein